MINVGYAYELSKVSKNKELLNLARQIQTEHLKININKVFSLIDIAIKVSNSLQDSSAFDFFVEINKYVNLQIPFLNAEISFLKGDNEKPFEFISKGINESKKSEFYYNIALLRAFVLVNEYAISEISRYSELMIHDFNLSLNIVMMEFDEVMKKPITDIKIEKYYKKDLRGF